jgi:hypothetical protein
MIPTKRGLFLRYDEYEVLMEKLRAIQGGMKQFEIGSSHSRKILGFQRMAGHWELILKAGSKEAQMFLSMAEIQSLASFSIPNNIFPVMQEIIWD